MAFVSSANEPRQPPTRKKQLLWLHDVSQKTRKALGRSPKSGLQPVSQVEQSVPHPAETVISGDASSDCPFLQKLPLEIRQIIYDYILGGQTIRVIFPHRSMIMQAPIYRSRHDSASAVLNKQRFNIPPSAPGRGRRRIFQQGDLNMMLTCSQIYAESFNVVFAQSLFVFELHINTVLLSSLLSFKGLNAIRRLEWAWDLPYPPVQRCLDLDDTDSVDVISIWKSIWRVIASLDSLRELKMELIIPTCWRSAWELLISQTIAPLRLPEIHVLIKVWESQKKNRFLS